MKSKTTEELKNHIVQLEQQLKEKDQEIEVLRSEIAKHEKNVKWLGGHR